MAKSKNNNCLLAICFAFILSVFNIPYSFAQKDGKNVAYKQPVVVGCQCYKDIEVPEKTPDGHDRYYPLLKNYSTYNDVLKMSGWALDGGENVYKQFKTDTAFMDRNSDALQTSFSIISNSPFKFTHPDKTFGVNLTPCISKPTMFKLSVDVNYREPLFTWGREKFDSTSRAYLHVLLANTNNKPSVLLEVLLNEIVEGNGNPGMLKLNNIIVQTNKKYGTNIEKINAAKFNSDNFFEAFIRQVAERTDLEKYINDEFIATPGKPHHIDENEKAILGELFKCDMDHFDRDFLKSQYAAFFKVNYLGFDIANTILRQWNESKGVPVKSETGKFLSAAILANVSKVQSSTTDGLKMNIKNIYFTPSEIVGTGIVLNFDHAQVISTNDSNEELVSYEYFPQFIIPPTVVKPSKKKYTNDDEYEEEILYDDVLTRFTGLLVDKGNIHFNYKGKIIYATIEGLLINNKVIAGRICVSKKVGNANIITIKSGNQQINATVTELKRYLATLGLSNLSVVDAGSELWIYFKKTYR